MKCPNCDANDSKVTDSRETGAGIRRRRECLTCAHRFSTSETVRIPVIQVHKQDGTRQNFSRDKLLAGLKVACTRRPVTQRTLDRLVDGIEAELQRSGSGIVKSRDLGLMALEQLRILDEVAYLRFASVYHDFQSAADFEELARSVRIGQPEPMGIAAVTGRRTRSTPRHRPGASQSR